ncbi:hypothetical protein RRG08_050525 [Elysia crispata]|uniref:Uncharacterized protein n=1 Tax=Elysia crispata TaxID=231223 RepID=A0AAE0ZU39_9GAST|nr:hypothetical protein RRG08_050525 [Elysia crispata]
MTDTTASVRGVYRINRPRQVKQYLGLESSTESSLYPPSIPYAHTPPSRLPKILCVNEVVCKECVCEVINVELSVSLCAVFHDGDTSFTASLTHSSRWTVRWLKVEVSTYTTCLVRWLRVQVNNFTTFHGLVRVQNSRSLSPFRPDLLCSRPAVIGNQALWNSANVSSWELKELQVPSSYFYIDGSQLGSPIVVNPQPRDGNSTCIMAVTPLTWRRPAAKPTDPTPARHSSLWQSAPIRRSLHPAERSADKLDLSGICNVRHSISGGKRGEEGAQNGLWGRRRGWEGRKRMVWDKGQFHGLSYPEDTWSWMGYIQRPISWPKSSHSLSPLVLNRQSQHPARLKAIDLGNMPPSPLLHQMTEPRLYDYYRPDRRSKYMNTELVNFKVPLNSYSELIRVLDLVLLTYVLKTAHGPPGAQHQGAGKAVKAISVMGAVKVLALFCCVSCVGAELSERLRYFETLHHVNMKVRRRRSANLPHLERKDVSFSALGRTFDLTLTPGTPVVGSDFTAKVVHRDGSTSDLFVDLNNFYNGHLSGDESVKADAFMEDGIWTANIYDKDEIYTLEPSSPHLPKSDNHTMIVYKQSDIVWDSIYPDLAKSPNQRKKMCGGIHAEDDPDYDPELEELEIEKELVQEHQARYKRAVRENTCHIIAVADKTFFDGPGGGFPHKTANSIIQSMQSVNNIYRNVVWNSELQLSGLGFQIKELRIHDDHTADDDFESNNLHYNMRREHWKDIDLLKQFGRDKHFHKFCLAHLFTHRSFDGGVLGLAYIASSRRGTLGGICSTRRSGGRTLNTGFSSSMNTKGNNLLTQEAVLVTTHGHNWGAEHDAETSECAPSSFNNGKYVMYPYAVSGYEENNKKFSPCSKRYITEVLTSKSDRCFKEEDQTTLDGGRYQPNVPMCGNGLLDPGEECDGGGMGLSGLDKCCSPDCMLIGNAVCSLDTLDISVPLGGWVEWLFIGNAVCSPVNHECCVDCLVAAKDTPCRGESKELCRMAAYCPGNKNECPDSKAVDNGTDCIDGGKCSLTGECLNYCEYEGRILNLQLFPCRCEEAETACLRCCKTWNGLCEPRGKKLLTDGRPCIFGYCEAGQCKEGKGSTIQRLFTFIETLDSSTLVAFMKSNIVGTVIVFSLIVWIPMSWVISCMDKRRERESRQRELAWVSNDVLLSQSLQSNMLANRFKDYKVKESDYHRSTGRPLLNDRTNLGGAAGSNNYQEHIPPRLELNAPPTYSNAIYGNVRDVVGKAAQMETSI